MLWETAVTTAVTAAVNVNVKETRFENLLLSEDTGRIRHNISKDTVNKTIECQIYRIKDHLSPSVNRVYHQSKASQE